MDRSISDFSIINGKLHDPDYPYSFHTYRNGPQVTVKILLPGIIHESLIIRPEGNRMTLKARFIKSFTNLFQAEIIELEGELPYSVRKGVLVTDYESGILTIELVQSE